MSKEDADYIARLSRLSESKLLHSNNESLEERISRYKRYIQEHEEEIIIIQNNIMRYETAIKMLEGRDE